MKRILLSFEILASKGLLVEIKKVEEGRILSFSDFLKKYKIYLF